MATLFLVDNSDEMRLLETTILLKRHHVVELRSSTQLYALLDAVEAPDMILLDDNLPHKKSMETLELLKSQALFSKIPVVILSSTPNAQEEGEYFQAGAAEYIGKPVSETAFLARVGKSLKSNSIELKRAKRINEMQYRIMSVLAEVIDRRDHATGAHVLRTSAYIKILTEEMLRNGVYSNETKEWTLEHLISSANLHDVGKISVPDTILNKPGKLTVDEFEIVKAHAHIGEQIIEKMVMTAGGGAFLSLAKIFAGTHHEWWNGTGYPRNLCGTDIPLEGRVLAIADVYDALISARPYKRAFSHEEAEQIIVSEAGTHFDPILVNIFYNVRKRFRTVELLT